MAITITHPVDELKLRELSDDGYTTFKLYYTDELDGNFADSSASIDQDIATALLGNPPYKFVFTFANGNPAYWYKVVAYDGVSAISPLNEVTPFHGGGGTTLKALRRKIGSFTDTMVEGTTTGASADGSSLTANSALFNRFADDYFGGVANTKG